MIARDVEADRAPSIDAARRLRHGRVEEGERRADRAVARTPTIRAARRRCATRRADRLAALILFVVLVAAPMTGSANAQNESALSRFSWGVGAGLCTLIYTPLKIVYAATAIPLGGLVWLWSVGDDDVAGRVIVRATAGDFVVTPEHLKRERPLIFLGAREPSSSGETRSLESDLQSGLSPATVAPPPEWVESRGARFVARATSG